MADKTIPDFVFPPGGEKPDMSRDDLAVVAVAVAALSPEDQSLLAAVQVSPYRLTTAEQFREFPGAPRVTEGVSGRAVPGAAP